MNWADTSQRVLLRRGAVGQIRRGRMAFVAEVRSLALSEKHKVNGLRFYSDKGSQYAAYDTRNYVQRMGYRQSMSGKGNCYDNAPMESFWHSLKVEETHERGFETREDAKRCVFGYIEEGSTTRRGCTPQSTGSHRVSFDALLRRSEWMRLSRRRQRSKTKVLSIGSRARKARTWLSQCLQTNEISHAR